MREGQRCFEQCVCASVFEAGSVVWPLYPLVRARTCGTDLAHVLRVCVSRTRTACRSLARRCACLPRSVPAAGLLRLPLPASLRDALVSRALLTSCFPCMRFRSLHSFLFGFCSLQCDRRPPTRRASSTRARSCSGRSLRCWACANANGARSGGSAGFPASCVVRWPASVRALFGCWVKEARGCA